LRADAHTFFLVVQLASHSGLCSTYNSNSGESETTGKDEKGNKAEKKE